MSLRWFNSRAWLVALVVASAVGLVVTPQAVGAAPQEQQEEQEQEEQQQEKQERAARREAEAIAQALQAAQQAIEAHREQLATAMQEGVAAQREAVLAQEEQLRHELGQMRERMRVVAPQLARARAFGFMGGGADRILANAEELGLTEDQKEQIRTADKAARRSRIERDARIEVAELDLEDMVRDLEAADLGAVESKMMEIAQLRVQGRIADLRLRQQLDGVLTQEQRDKLEDMGGNVLMLRGDGAHWRMRGPGAALFAPESDDLVFSFGELLEPLEWIEEFELEPRHFEFRFFDDDQQIEAAPAPEAPPAPPAGIRKRSTGTSGSAAPVAPTAPGLRVVSRSF